MNETAPATPPPPAKGRLGCFIVMLALLSGGTWWAIKNGTGDAAGGPPGMGKGGGKGGPGGMYGAPTAVTAEDVTQEDFEEWVNLSGTVTPLNVVTVRSRVDGELMRILFKEGQTVKAGDLLAEIDPRPIQVQLDQAKAALARNQALQDNARADLARYEALLKQDSIAKQQVDTQASLVHQYDAAMASDRATIASSELQLSYTHVTAPIAGRVGLRQIDAGNMVRAGDLTGLVIITQMDPMGLVCAIPQERVTAVRKRLAGSAEVSVEAVDKEMNLTLAKGKLITTDNQIDLASGTLKLKAELPNPDGALFPNQFVITRLLVDVQPGATVAPSNAIQRGANGAYCYLLNADSSVSLRNIKTGPMHGDRTLIKEGLAPGDKVITQGVDRLRDGAKVEVIPPAEATASAPTSTTEAKSKEQGEGEGKKGKSPTLP